MTCKGICEKYKAKKPLTGSRYAKGQKQCTVCDIFIIWDGVSCPCCSQTLRRKPRKSILKELLKVEMV